jgi:2-dehydro-3-deoxygalactonokinase
MKGPTTRADWIAVDWGTTHMRAFAIGAAGTILAETSSDDGMRRMTRDAFEPALLRAVTPWLRSDGRTPVLACGMVGSRQGWHEAPYRRVPCAPLDPSSLVVVPTRDDRLDLRLIPGLCQLRPADVMRGEETQIAGFLAPNPGWSGMACLPGTHSKWVEIRTGEVAGFQTFMTGELFALLAEHSVLRHSIAVDGWNAPAFTQAVQETVADPERSAARLFTLRAEALVGNLDPSAARARLSGMLIGAELAATKSLWRDQDVAVIGSAGLLSAYVAALTAVGARPRSEPGPALVVAGLAAAFAAIRLETPG